MGEIPRVRPSVFGHLTWNFFANSPFFPSLFLLLKEYSYYGYCLSIHRMSSVTAALELGRETLTSFHPYYRWHQGLEKSYAPNIGALSKRTCAMMVSDSTVQRCVRTVWNSDAANVHQD